VGAFSISFSPDGTRRDAFEHVPGFVIVVVEWRGAIRRAGGHAGPPRSCPLGDYERSYWALPRIFPASGGADAMVSVVVHRRESSCVDAGWFVKGPYNWGCLYRWRKRMYAVITDRGEQLLVIASRPATQYGM